MKTKNILSFSLILLAFGATIMSFKLPEPEGDFKNLKVLPKNISKKALDSTMEYYTTSLGVRCGFCHARKADTTQRGLDFASDAKTEKGRAREMMNLTAYINTNYFNGMQSTRTDTIKTVTCFTCHRGAKEPTANNLKDQFKSMIPERKKK